jgi:competence protein ComEC
MARVSPLVSAVALAAGIALAPVAPGPAWWPVAATVALAGVAIARRGTSRTVAIASAIVAFGLLRGAPRPHVAPAGTTPDDREPDQITGVVGGPLVPGPHGVGAPVDTGDTVVWVWAPPDGPTPVPGQRVAVTGPLHTPRGYLDPGVPDRAAVMAERGADWEMTARELVVLDDDPDPLALAWRTAAAAQARWSARIAAGGGDGRAALAGIAMGTRGDVSPALDQRWRVAGIYHVLSVSGLHLAIVAGLAFAALRRLVAASPFGGRHHPARWAAPPALLIAIAYTLVTGAQLATLRALVVVALVLIAAALDRPLRLTDALGAAALALLAWRPCDLRDPSFQLSFVAALTLAHLPRAPRPDGRLARARAWLVRGVTSSLWVTLTTAPITAYHFHQVAIGGAIGNLVLTPAVELVALPLALAGLAIGEVAAPAGDALIDAAAWIVGAVDDLAGLLARVVPVGTVGVAGAATMAVLVALSLWLAARARTWRSAVAWAALCAAWATARDPAPAGALRVTFLDVGQGDAAIVELPDGATWLVDAGGAAGARDLTAASAPGRAIDATLAVRGRTRVDLAIVSHPHPDHYLGLAGMATPIDELWSAADPEAHAIADRPGQPSFATVAAGLGARVVHPPLGVARREAGVELAVWGPRRGPNSDGPDDRIATVDPVRTVNDNSLVVSITYAGRTVLFAGDIEVEGEAAFAAGMRTGPGRSGTTVDVVKVPHHGSPTSSSAGFVAATRPALAVISCGVANQFNFPAPGVVARWQAAGAAIARTDRDGAVTVTIDEAGHMDVSRVVR